MWVVASKGFMARSYYWGWYQINSPTPFETVPEAVFLIVSVIRIVAVSECLEVAVPF